MIRYGYNTQKQPPAPFVRLTLRHPHTGAEARDVPAQLDTGADQTVVPAAAVERLGLDFSGSIKVRGLGGKSTEVEVYTVLLGVHDRPPQPVEVLAHPGEPWVLLGRDVLNHFRVLLDGPNPALELG